MAYSPTLCLVTILLVRSLSLALNGPETASLPDNGQSPPNNAAKADDRISGEGNPAAIWTKQDDHHDELPPAQDDLDMPFDGLTRDELDNTDGHGFFYAKGSSRPTFPSFEQDRAAAPVVECKCQVSDGSCKNCKAFAPEVKGVCKNDNDCYGTCLCRDGHCINCINFSQKTACKKPKDCVKACTCNSGSCNWCTDVTNGTKCAELKDCIPDCNCRGGQCSGCPDVTNTRACKAFADCRPQCGCFDKMCANCIRVGNIQCATGADCVPDKK